MKNLTKQQKLQFIKDFSKIKVCNLCEDLGIDKSNLYRRKLLRF